MNKLAAVGKFSHVKPGDTDYKGGGLRDFFLYRDLGIAEATQFLTDNEFHALIDHAAAEALE